jgi:hypothetical protein
MAKRKGSPRNNKGAKRYTILFDEGVYRAGKAKAKQTGAKLYFYINALVAKDTNQQIPEYLKHTAVSDD